MLTLKAQLLSSGGRTPKFEVRFDIAAPSMPQSGISQESAIARARAERSTFAVSHRPTKPWGLDYTSAFPLVSTGAGNCSLVQQSLTERYNSHRP